MFLRTIMTALILSVLAVGFIYWSFPQTVEPSTQKTPVIDEVIVPAPIETATIETKPAEVLENNELNVEIWGRNEGGNGVNLPEAQIDQSPENETAPQAGIKKRLNTSWNMARKVTKLAEVLLGGVLPKKTEAVPDITVETPEVAELSNDVPEPPTVQSPQQGIGKGLNKTWNTARKVTTLAEVMLGRVLPNGARKSDESAILVTTQPEIIGVDVSEIPELSSFETDDTTASSGFNTLYHQGFVEAQNITGPIQRDQAYLRLIDFALANKKIGRTQRIVPFLSTPESRDQARRAVALAYANNNQTVAALEISDSFENKGLKAELYAQILNTDSSIEPYQVPRK